MIYGAHIAHLTSTFQNSIWSEIMFFFTPYLAFFFIKSGYLHKVSHQSLQTSMIALLKKRVCMVLPFALIGFICSIIISQEDFIFTTLSACKWLVLNGSFPSNGPLWFIATLIFCELLTIILERVFTRWIFIAIIFLIGTSLIVEREIILFWNIQNIFICMFFYIIGILYRKWEHLISNHVLFIVLPLVIINLYYNDSFIDLYNSKLVWGKEISFMLNSILFVISFSTIYNCYVKKSIPVFGFIGFHSMVYYALHFPILLLSLYVIPSIVGSNINAFYLFCSIVLICTIYALASKKYPILVGHIEGKAIVKT